MAKILLVDDSSTIVAMTKLILEGAGYTVLTAGDGMEGLAMARRENPDLVLLDLMLPRLDGFAVCRMLKFDQHYQHIPVILFTAKAAEADKKIGREVGADDYLTKEFDAPQLLAMVENHLKNPPPHAKA